jgi:hypothetical protein
VLSVGPGEQQVNLGTGVAAIDTYSAHPSIAG